MHSDEFAVILIKPDATERGLESDIFNELVAEDLIIIKMGTVQFDLNFVLDFYQWLKIDYPEVINDYICVNPLPVWVARGDRAISKAMSVKNRLRAKYCNHALKNLFHCPSSKEESQRKYDLLVQRHKPMENKKIRTKNQVEAIVFKRLMPREFLFLMLKRNPERGGFWQPVTGNVEEGESFEVAALREVQEELGIKTIVKLIDTGYSYEFTDNGLDQFERIFGVEVSINQDVNLSPEHTEYKWTSKEDALAVYLKYPGNKEGLRRLYDKVKGGLGE